MPGPASRRFDFPPLWAVPLLLIAGVFLLVYLGIGYGLLGLVVIGVVLWWVEPRVDAYVRRRQALQD